MVTNILRTFVLLRFVIQVHVAAQNLDVVVHVEFSRYPHIGMSHSALYRIYVCTFRAQLRAICMPGLEETICGAAESQFVGARHRHAARRTHIKADGGRGAA